MNENLDELKDLVAAIKADHQAQKDKEKRDAWTKFVALSMICLATLAAIASQKGAGFSSATMKQLNEATYTQALASDQWAYFQAKGIKQSLNEAEGDLVTVMEKDLKIGTTDAARLAALTATIARYNAEKKDASDKATAYEKARDQARTLSGEAATRSQGIGLATTIFQIAIALGGVCLVVKKRWLWGASLLLGMLAAAKMVWVLFN